MQASHPHMWQEVKQGRRKKDSQMGRNVSWWGWRVRSWKGVFYFLSNKSAESIAKSQSEWAHRRLSVAWTDVSSFIHTAGSKRRKKALLLTLSQVSVEQGLLGWFWQWHIDFFVCLGLKRNLLDIFLWRSSREDGFTSLGVGGLCSGLPTELCSALIAWSTD